MSDIAAKSHNTPYTQILHSGIHSMHHQLAAEVICSPDFWPEDVTGFNTHQENKKLDEADAKATGVLLLSDDWQEVAIEIDVPVGEELPCCQGIIISQKFQRFLHMEYWRRL